MVFSRHPASGPAPSPSPSPVVAPAGVGDAWHATQPSGRSLARTLGLQFLLGALVACIAVLLPSPDESDESYLLAMSGIAVVFGLVLRFAPRAGERSVNVGILGVLGLLTVAVTVARPMGLAPLFYLWPLMLTVNYASTPRLVATTALTIALFGAALAFGAATEDAPAAFVEFSLLTISVVAGMRRLRVRNSELYGQLCQQATLDGLTGALNRAAFEESVASATTGPDADADAEPAALLMLDIDHFKAVNDEHGHPAGDAALRHLSAVVGRLGRPGDVFGRVGGEEFAVLLPATSEETAVLLADRMRRAIAARAAGIVPFTVSIGVAGDGRPGMWAAADRALYAAKRAGRDRVVAAGPATCGRRAPAPVIGVPPRRTHLTLLDRDQGGFVMPRRDG